MVFCRDIDGSFWPARGGFEGFLVLPRTNQMNHPDRPFLLNFRKFFKSLFWCPEGILIDFF